LKFINVVIVTDRFVSQGAKTICDWLNAERDASAWELSLVSVGGKSWGARNLTK
jgi:hypothetical protein